MFSACKSLISLTVKVVFPGGYDKNMDPVTVDPKTPIATLAPYKRVCNT